MCKLNTFKQMAKEKVFIVGLCHPLLNFNALFPAGF